MATAFFRTVILYLLLIAGLRITGKRQIGELEPIELVLTMLLSDLASVPMQDFGILWLTASSPSSRCCRCPCSSAMEVSAASASARFCAGSRPDHPQRPHPAGRHAPQPPDGG